MYICHEQFGTDRVDSLSFGLWVHAYNNWNQAFETRPHILHESDVRIADARKGVLPGAAATP